MRFKFFLYSILSISIIANAQISTKFIDSSLIDAEKIIGVDTFETIYYTTNNNTFHKKNKDTTITYTNVQLGKVSSANSFNPLKINLFYKDFNTTIILDNRLAEIFKTDFNFIRDYKFVTHVSTGYDNTMWLFNQDSQQLELFDYKANTTKVKSLPIDQEILDLKSNYNFSWLLTKEFLYKFNYFGIVQFKIKNNGFSEIQNFNGNLILKKNNELFFLKDNSLEFVEIDLPKLLINDFFVNNETLYIYDTKSLYKYLLKLN